MNHTTNYSLNQWEADDRVTRADFNADNVAIDAALTGLDAAVAGIEPSPLVKVWEHTTTAAGQEVELDAAALGLANSKLLLMVFDLNTSETTGVYMNPSNITDGFYEETSGGSIQRSSCLSYIYNWGIVYLFEASCMNHTHAKSYYYHFGKTVYHHGYFEGRLSQVEKLRIYPMDSSFIIPAGARFTLYGLK